MTDLKRPVKRKTYGVVHEAGKPRQIIVILIPPQTLGFRAAGCRRIYTLTVEGCYKMAPWAKVEADNRAKKLVMKKSKQGD